MTGDARIGTTLQGKYAIERVIGEGGMGIVYAARHVRLDRPVAIKLLHATYARDRVALDRFLDEARAAGSLRHPNVVDVVDVDVDRSDAHGETPFMVQELLVGEPLSALLERRGALPLAETLALIEPVLDALEAAHARGIVHRDIKPDNVFLAREAGKLVPKLLDFGIAKLRDGSSGAATATGTAVGTPTYMAPEQARGSVRDLGEHTDVWSIAVVLYQCLSGRMHFDFSPDAGVLGWLGLVATGRPRPLRDVAPSVPETIARAIDAALDVDFRTRTPTVAALRAELRGEARPEQTRPLDRPGVMRTPDAAVPATRRIDTPPSTRGGATPRSRALAFVAALGVIAIALVALVLGVTSLGMTSLGATSRAEPATASPPSPPQPAPAGTAQPVPTEAAPVDTRTPDEPASSARAHPEAGVASSDGAPVAGDRAARVRAARERASEHGNDHVSDDVQPIPRVERGDPDPARTRSGEWRVDDL